MKNINGTSEVVEGNFIEVKRNASVLFIVTITITMTLFSVLVAGALLKGYPMAMDSLRHVAVELIQTEAETKAMKENAAKVAILELKLERAMIPEATVGELLNNRIVVPAAGLYASIKSNFSAASKAVEEEAHPTVVERFKSWF